MELQSIFSFLGLKDEHRRMYLANLGWGETSITNIAYKAKVPRTSAYVYMEDLLEMGLLLKRIKQGKSFYKAADPEYLEVLLNQKQMELEHSRSTLRNNFSQLQAMQNNTTNKPKIELLEGSEGIKQAYDRTFEAEEIWIQCLTEEYGTVVSDKFFEEYFKKFFEESTIRSKEILKLEDEEYVSKYQSSKNLQLRVPVEQKTETDFWVYDNKVTFVSFNSNRPYALVIEDPDIARCVKNMFDLAWKRASTIDPRVMQGESIKTEF
ncbi:hypothetical protein KC717_03505 [Candidatus Dojkabacteria bacterium]|uniref:Transcription regulator TrmB N-terminal domain-containing protein n=1 Tax=Candidatus Dojkabacteria bacterium TaxID=2099670 RepID=A0A955RKE2_9BACT|nr:hypothetical protein [Candidatus Dojkabacteria bacterium]